MNLPLYQVLLGGLVSVIIAVLAYLQAGRVADRQARAQLELKRLEHEHGTHSFWHEDYRALNEKWLQCVEERARCEAERAALIKENAELQQEKQSLAEQAAHLDFENREARQKLVFVDFIRHDGRLDGAQIIEFGRRLLESENDVKEPIPEHRLATPRRDMLGAPACGSDVHDVGYREGISPK